MNHIYCDGGTWDKQYVAMGRHSESKEITILPRVWEPQSNVLSEVYRRTDRTALHDLHGKCVVYEFDRANLAASANIQIVKKSSSPYF